MHKIQHILRINQKLLPPETIIIIYAECSDEKKGRDYKRRIIVMELFINFVFRIFIEPFNAIISDF